MPSSSSYPTRLASIALAALALLPQHAHALSLSTLFDRIQPRAIAAAETTLWVVEDIYQGNSFFDEWDFFNATDPTNGQVTYVDAATAFGDGLAYVADGQATMRVDNWSELAENAPRNSVRIQSKKVYNGGLFILDVKHAPFGCGVWPGYWTLGTSAQWPAGGEIDILEGVHNNQHDQVTWHTAAGCSLTTPGNFSGTALTTNCEANVVGGCGIVDWSRASYGLNFDQLGGGVYAMRWDADAIDVWFFYRATIPADIASGVPNPSPQTWGVPSASLSRAGCDLGQFFVDHAIVFDMTLCGDWAGASYSQDGCPGTCSQAVMDPANFDNASWVINSLSVYRQTVLQGLSSSPAQPRATPSGFVGLVLALAAAGLALL